MSDLNKVMIIGRFGQDPEIRVLESGESVATLSVATGEKWKDKNTGEKKEKTEWHRFVAFGSIVKNVIEPYCRKGGQAYLEGSLRTRKWQDKQGNDRWTTEIVLQQIQLLGGKNDGGSGRREQPPQGDPPRTGGTTRQPAPASAPTGGAPAKDDFDDDIPF